MNARITPLVVLLSLACGSLACGPRPSGDGTPTAPAQPLERRAPNADTGAQVSASPEAVPDAGTPEAAAANAGGAAAGLGYAELCPEIVALDPGDRQPSGGRADVVVSARLAVRSSKGGSSGPTLGPFVASVVVPKLGVDREVFAADTAANPYQCCVDAGEAGLDVSCTTGGIDTLRTQATARREGDELVVRWCTAAVGANKATDRGAIRKPIASKAVVRFAPASPRCSPSAVP